MASLFEAWFRVVRRTFSADTRGWGLSNRYEASNRQPRLSHEALLKRALERDGYSVKRRGYADRPRARCDGYVTSDEHQEEALRYELKTVFLPHYWTREDSHNDDFARLLRHEHPSGALGDVDRLRTEKSKGECCVFLLLGITWTVREAPPATFRIYERHRDTLLKAFEALAELPTATQRFRVRGTTHPWSTDVRAWVL